MTAVEPAVPSAPAAAAWVCRDTEPAISFRDAELDLLRPARPVPTMTEPLLTAVRSLSADGPRRLGGDAYSITTRGDEMLLLVADARGKGDGAAALAQAALRVFRTVTENRARWNPAGLAGVLDETVRCADQDEDFMTAVLVHARRGGDVHVVSCGHPPPLVISRKSVRPIELDPCQPLGLGGTPAPVQDRLGSGDRLLLYTDGGCEAADAAGQFFDIEKHAAVLRCSDVQVAVDALLGRLMQHTAGASQDDVTLLLAAREDRSDGAARRTGHASPNVAAPRSSAWS